MNNNYVELTKTLFGFEAIAASVNQLSDCLCRCVNHDVSFMCLDVMGGEYYLSRHLVKLAAELSQGV